jgi:hypothetical protein
MNLYEVTYVYTVDGKQGIKHHTVIAYDKTSIRMEVGRVHTREERMYEGKDSLRIEKLGDVPIPFFLT